MAGGSWGSATRSILDTPHGGANDARVIAVRILDEVGRLGSEFTTLEGWLPFVDDYRTKCIVPGPSFQLILESAMQHGLPA
jgi:hypothetical protein